MSPPPQLSVVIVAGVRRHRVGRLLTQLGCQSVADRLEVVVVDAAPSRLLPTAPPKLQMVHLPAPEVSTLEAARAVGFQATTGAVVAFLQDHAEVDPGWAEAVLEASADGVGAIGFRFRPPHHGGLVTRALFLAEYGPWAAPGPGGPVDRLPGHNVAYSREALGSLGQSTDQLLAVDLVAQEALAAAGYRLVVAERAEVVHSSGLRLRAVLAAHLAYARILSARRCSQGSRRRWRSWRRVAFALSAPLVLPPLRMTRLLRELRGRPQLRHDLLLGLPIVVAVWTAAAVGESLGMLAGTGRAGRIVCRIELTSTRRHEP